MTTVVGTRPGGAGTLPLLQRPGWVALLFGVVLGCAAWLATKPFPLPAEEWRLATAEFHRLDGANLTAGPVSLPHNWAKTQGGAGTGQYSITLEKSIFVDTKEDIVLFVPRFTYRLEVRLNGHMLATSAVTPSIETIARNTSMLVPLHHALWKEGKNTLELRLEARGNISGFLDTLFVGPDSALRPAHEKQLLLFIWLPVVLAALSLGMAVILFLFWWRREGEEAYGLMGLALICDALLALNFLPVSLWFDPKIHLAWHAAPVFEGALIALAIRRMLGLQIGWRWALLVPGAVLPLLVWIAGVPFFIRSMMLVGTPLNGLLIAYISWLGLRAALREGNALGLWLSLSTSVILLYLALDLLVITSVLGEGRILLSRSVYPLLTSVLATFMILRFVTFLNLADNFAHTLKQRVSEAEQALRASFARDQAHLQAGALASERARLMRDLHDGVGGQLVSIVASAERLDADPRAIGDAARMALRDMRLVIDAMDDVGGELMLVLATWRERAETQLRSLDIRLQLVIENETGLPTFEGLRPLHVLNILRILEEAITNVIKHSRAQNVELRLKTVKVQSGAMFGQILLRDDGKGGVAAHSAGRGLANMAQRAATVKGALTITSDESGTLVQLDIPAKLPALP